MKKELDNWNKRDFIPFGKVTVIKYLVLSKIVYVLQAFPTHTLILKKLKTSFTNSYLTPL